MGSLEAWIYEPMMNLRQALALAIKTTRKARHLTQDDFGCVSSRTYLSTLERGLKSPTLDKLDVISQTMEIHPASIVLLAYAILAGHENAQAMIDRVVTESNELLSKFHQAKLGE